MVNLLEYFYLANLSQLIDFLVNSLQLMMGTPRAKLHRGLEILLHLNEFHCFVCFILCFVIQKPFY